MSLNQLSRLKRTFSRFGRAEGGNVALIFAISLPVLLVAIGAAIDYARAANARSAMQAAIDATALMISKEAANMTPTEVKTRADSYFRALYNYPEVGVASFEAAYTPNGGNGASVTIKATASMSTDFMKMAGVTQMPFDVSTTTKWGNMRYRVALALDNTGSMSSSDKIGQLKIATKKLIEDFYTMASGKDDVYISIVPFAKGVNVGTGNVNATWLRWDKLPTENAAIDTAWEAEPPVMSTWLANNVTLWEQTGPGSACPFTNSNHGFRCASTPTGTSTVSNVPSSGSFSGYICPSTDNGNLASYRNGIQYNGCYNSVQSQRTISTGSQASCGSTQNCSCSGSGSSRACKQTYYQHTWIKNARSTWGGCVADRDKDYDVGTSPLSTVRATMAPAEQYSYCGESVLGMTSVKDSKQTLINKVDAMYPNGSTNQGIGLAWAWLTHASSGPFTAPVQKDANYGYQDVIILLTDGLNTQNRYAGNGSDHSPAIDDRQALMCTNIKREGVKIFAVQVATSGDPQSTMLKNCTSEPDNPNYFSYITQASQMTVKFQNIFKELSKLRVSS